MTTEYVADQVRRAAVASQYRRRAASLERDAKRWYQQGLFLEATDAALAAKVLRKAADGEMKNSEPA